MMRKLELHHFVWLLSSLLMVALPHVERLPV
jgi:hypothetical protein